MWFGVDDGVLGEDGINRTTDTSFKALLLKSKEIII